MERAGKGGKFHMLWRLMWLKDSPCITIAGRQLCTRDQLQLSCPTQAAIPIFAFERSTLSLLAHTLAGLARSLHVTVTRSKHGRFTTRAGDHPAAGSMDPNRFGAG